MSTARIETTLRQRIEGVLRQHPGRGVALSRFYELLPDAGVTQVRQAFKNLMKCSRVIRHGTTRHPAYQLVREDDPLHQPIQPAPARKSKVKDAARVIWPDHILVKQSPVPARQTPPFEGIDWSRSVLRPGCQDHLLVPSRRGDVRVMHKGLISVRSTKQRKELTQ